MDFAGGAGVLRGDFCDRVRRAAACVPRRGTLAGLPGTFALAAVARGASLVANASDLRSFTESGVTLATFKG